VRPSELIAVSYTGPYSFDHGLGDGGDFPRPLAVLAFGGGVTDCHAAGLRLPGAKVARLRLLVGDGGDGPGARVAHALGRRRLVTGRYRFQVRPLAPLGWPEQLPALRLGFEHEPLARLRAGGG